ncbi:MAG: Aminodeoxychorismate lyase [Candidatus Gottesmanbacteria bacterium GW2011_GWA2_42_18]|uniref:Endolytic murein transglycosylase n=2 Tax=Candidatus Gottesmaniibacteriota TaxID=1752720 RepID=A0A0G0ZH31_9BACT|nr:MAG: Aminodeoxychorismate lyase [Candidatus Gottesmanbacteria bacterium GW2011_GWA2_42_18]KKS76224.1 MAG: Aminodeoxychorismate lyase [Candidatus Gottesmanbacteria bacterium GW2011_GWC2_42_8]
MMFTRFVSLLVLFILIYFAYLISPASLSSEEIRFVVPLNEKQSTTLERVGQAKLVKNQAIFKLISYFLKIPAKIEPGAYKINKKMWLPQIAWILLYEPYQKWAVLPPGLRKEQVAEILSKTFKWDQSITQSFIKQAEEGYLFPDTYLFDSAGTPEDHLNRISNNFNDKFDAKLQKDLLAQDVRNDTAIKIASLIERETGSDEDKPIIAGIIWNRLNTDMKLQIDATSQYILGQPGNWWPRIKPADHKRESPYNTYLFQGLPPGPISNPSLASIKAVVYPAQTDCLYYIHDRNKSIHCSRNYEGHLENIEKYLKN